MRSDQRRLGVQNKAKVVSQVGDGVKYRVQYFGKL